MTKKDLIKAICLGLIGGLIMDLVIYLSTIYYITIP